MDAMFGVAQNAQEVAGGSAASDLRAVAGRGHQHGRGLDSGAQRGPRGPVQALQKGRYQVLGAGENRLRRNVALIAPRRSLACLRLAEHNPRRSSTQASC